MNGENKIFLIGFMGSGKSTIGRKLAARLNWSFIDLDQKIEEMTGSKISDIFLTEGEAWFRDVEARLLKSLDTEKNTVISTGGGTPCSGDNMDYMLETGITVYLKLTPEQLKGRLAGSPGNRPLIKGLETEALGNYISVKLSEREKYYSKAKITVDGFETDFSILFSSVKKFIHD